VKKQSDARAASVTFEYTMDILAMVSLDIASTPFVLEKKQSDARAVAVTFEYTLNDQND
jgi:hypothetical protein